MGPVWAIVIKKDIKDRGFCVKGKKHQTICFGDSGSPAIWYNKSGEPYLIGISYLGQVKCGRKRYWSGRKIFKWDIPKLQKSVYPSLYVSVPGELFKWLGKNGGKELKDMIDKCWNWK